METLIVLVCGGVILVVFAGALGVSVAMRSAQISRDEGWDD
jgi:hypothetical protein